MNEETFTPLEIDTLQEILNIAFGSATAELAEIIDIFIALDTPNVQIIDSPKLHNYIHEQTNIHEKCNIVEQHFYGEVKGVSLLIFSQGAGHELLSYFHKDKKPNIQTDRLEELDQEALIEIGNILIGACMSKLYELLQIHINYLPPRIIVARNFKQFFSDKSFNENKHSITLKTNFKFEDKNISGNLFIITNNESFHNLKKGLENFWKSIHEH